eukprot:TRINITY_DN6963_c0_g2_i1.p1 TRINITY_DN6963_c0_g2~~TRINITY_DN6963_c0_g2_i1.p1  ORF type:complete len:112 (+),score=19.41 TRINITY_DN6963_c0_g2_i1:99-434(+)
MYDDDEELQNLQKELHRIQTNLTNKREAMNELEKEIVYWKDLALHEQEKGNHLRSSNTDLQHQIDILSKRSPKYKNSNMLEQPLLPMRSFRQHFNSSSKESHYIPPDFAWD